MGGIKIKWAKTPFMSTWQNFPNPISQVVILDHYFTKSKNSQSDAQDLIQGSYWSRKIPQLKPELDWHQTFSEWHQTSRFRPIFNRLDKRKHRSDKRIHFLYELTFINSDKFELLDTQMINVLKVKDQTKAKTIKNTYDRLVKEKSLGWR